MTSQELILNLLKQEADRLGKAISVAYDKGFALIPKGNQAKKIAHEMKISLMENDLKQVQQAREWFKQETGLAQDKKANADFEICTVCGVTNQHHDNALDQCGFCDKWYCVQHLDPLSHPCATEWTIELVKDELPDVAVKIGNEIVMGHVRGRVNQFATVWIDAGADRQVAWETIRDILNDKTGKRAIDFNF